MEHQDAGERKAQQHAGDGRASAMPQAPPAAAAILRLQRDAGNRAVARRLRKEKPVPRERLDDRGVPPVPHHLPFGEAIKESRRPLPPEAPLGLRTKRPVRNLEIEFRHIITEARWWGFDVAAGNLEHFLDGGGKVRAVPLDWLRSHRCVKAAETRNQRRFEDSVMELARSMADGATAHVHEHWDADIDASLVTELAFASGMSRITSRGAFTLVRSGDQVTFNGFARHMWFDPFDWNEGSSALTPFGVISDDVGLDLRDAGRGHDYLLEVVYLQGLSGTYFLRTGQQRFRWSKP